jgi:diacylglycerol kinase (ATP)
MASDERRGLKQIAAAGKWSMQGLLATFKYEASFRLEFYLFLVLVPTAIYVANSSTQLLLLIACMLLVLILEIINSAIEAVVDLVCGNERHELAKRAKDMGSAAVFLGQMLVLYCWSVVIYQNYLI